MDLLPAYPETALSWHYCLFPRQSMPATYRRKKEPHIAKSVVTLHETIKQYYVLYFSHTTNFTLIQRFLPFRTQFS